MLEPVWPYSEVDIWLAHETEVDCGRREALTVAAMVSSLSFGCVLVTSDGGLDLVDDSRHDGCCGVVRDENCVMSVRLRILLKSGIVLIEEMYEEEVSGVEGAWVFMVLESKYTQRG